ncbi:MAG: NAD(+)/NADH kinase [Bifidobacteriaceae bacterium]|jgi:NAD+ kinase|nr:NAD(+)/NADH kinase [Bifidobacteriaceae bacterium]
MIRIVKGPNVDRNYLTKIIDRIEFHGKRVVLDNSEQKLSLVLSLGGDGTILKASEIAYANNVPILAINFGRMGFLTAADGADAMIILHKYFLDKYVIRKRRLLSVLSKDEEIGWALNDVALEKAGTSKMLALSISIDDVTLSTFGADSVLCSTATGSTAHAFSAGGPIMWPNVEAFEIVPIAAHALFSKPIIVGPKTKISIKVLLDSPSKAIISYDGRRNKAILSGESIDVSLSDKSISFITFANDNFTTKLVNKFQLPVHEWRYINNIKFADYENYG